MGEGARTMGGVPCQGQSGKDSIMQLLIPLVRWPPVSIAHHGNTCLSSPLHDLFSQASTFKPCKLAHSIIFGRWFSPHWTFLYMVQKFCWSSLICSVIHGHRSWSQPQSPLITMPLLAIHKSCLPSGSDNDPPMTTGSPLCQAQCELARWQHDWTSTSPSIRMSAGRPSSASCHYLAHLNLTTQTSSKWPWGHCHVTAKWPAWQRYCSTILWEDVEVGYVIWGRRELPVL